MLTPDDHVKKFSSAGSLGSPPTSAGHGNVCRRCNGQHGQSRLPIIAIGTTRGDKSMTLNRRFAIAFIAATLTLMSASAYAEVKTHHLALQISDNNPQKMNTVLNVAANASK
jgi:hypothetical protein